MITMAEQVTQGYLVLLRLDSNCSRCRLSGHANLARDVKARARVHVSGWPALKQCTFRQVVDGFGLRHLFASADSARSDVAWLRVMAHLCSKLLP